MASTERRFVSRAGLKLEHGLTALGVDVTGLVCADFGCNVGGFTDCLLKRGAATVYAIDTGYGTLAYVLRRDERVVVMERTNALHVDPAATVDLVVVDLAWTPQRHAIPAALKWLGPGGRILTLVKPHYELSDVEKRTALVDGLLPAASAPAVLGRVLAAMPSLGATVLGSVESPLTGGKSARRAGGGGNIEYLALLAPAAE